MMLTVGPSTRCVLFALASSPILEPTSSTKSLLKEAASPVPQGKQEAGVPLKKERPRNPLGPSEQRIEGTCNRNRSD